MPGMSGLDLATHLRKRHADLPVVLMSGWAEARALELAQPFVFLRKPFPLQGLFGAIGAMFADHPSAVCVAGASRG
jgi:FixJ family two-component response regulator